jgi:hypothetical protein
MKFKVGDKIRILDTGTIGEIKETGPYDYPLLMTPEYLVEYTNNHSRVHTTWCWEDELEKV